MKKLIIGLALAVGCRSGVAMASSSPAPAMPSGSLTGAASPTDAITAFMAAIKAEDLQALGGIWGTPDGPARNRMSMEDLQKRELTMLCYLHFDTYKVLDSAPAMNNERTYAVDMRYGRLGHTGQFNVGRASDGRYYVFSVVNFGDFQDFCAQKNAGN